MQGQQAIILAAGRGRRLGTLTDALPKPLVPVAGTPMLVRLVRQLRARGVERFVVVVGHHEAQIREAVQSAASAARCSFVANPDYETTNNAYSLWLAREALPRGGILVEADVVMEDSVLDAFLAYGDEAGWGTRPFEAGMDGALLEGDDDGILRRLTIVAKQETAPEGGFKSMGILRITKTYGQKLARWLDDEIRSGSLGRYYDLVIADHLDDHPLRLIVTNSGFWSEIDTLADLQAAEAALGAAK